MFIVSKIIANSNIKIIKFTEIEDLDICNSLWCRCLLSAINGD